MTRCCHHQCPVGFNVSVLKKKGSISFACGNWQNECYISGQLGSDSLVSSVHRPLRPCIFFYPCIVTGILRHFIYPFQQWYYWGILFIHYDNAFIDTLKAFYLSIFTMILLRIIFIHYDNAIIVNTILSIMAMILMKHFICPLHPCFIESLYLSIMQWYYWIVVSIHYDDAIVETFYVSITMIL